MSTSLSKADRDAIVKDLKDMLTSTNPGVFVSMGTCNERHNWLKRAILGLYGMVGFLFVGVVLAVLQHILG